MPAVIQATKMGMLFTFHRETGAPIFELVERAVPASDVPGEVAAATQRFPVAPPPLAAQGPLTPEDAWGLTFVDRWLCRRKLARFRSEGIYTPPSLEGTIMLPSDAGGSNWGGLAFDADRQLAFANVTNVAMVVRLIPRAEATADANASGDLRGLGAQRGTPYAVSREILFSPLGIPCNPPPWGTLAAVDMSAGEIRWQVPLGTTRDLAPWPWLAPRHAEPGRADRDRYRAGVHRRGHRQLSARLRVRHRRRAVARPAAGGWPGDADELRPRRQAVRGDRRRRPRRAGHHPRRRRGRIRPAGLSAPATVPAIARSGATKRPLLDRHGRWRAVAMTTGGAAPRCQAPGPAAQS